MINQIEIMGNKMILNPADNNLSRTLRKSIIYENASIQIIIKTLKPGQIFINIGANIGYFTLILARIVGKEGNGYSFEPDLVNFGFLRKNIKLNGYENIILEQCAVGDRDGMTYLYLNNKGNPGDHRTWIDKSEPREKNQIKIISLDNYFKGSDEHIDFIKIDAQGYEGKILDGMKNILTKQERLKIMMEIWPYGLYGCGSDPLKIASCLIHYGFHVFDIIENGTLKEINIINMIKNWPKNLTHKNIWLEKGVQ